MPWASLTRAGAEVKLPVSRSLCVSSERRCELPRTTRIPSAPTEQLTKHERRLPVVPYRGVTCIPYLTHCSLFLHPLTFSPLLILPCFLFKLAAPGSGEPVAALPSEPLHALNSPDSDCQQIQFLLGHASVQTTERYIGSKQKLQDAVNDRLGISVATDTA